MATAFYGKRQTHLSLSMRVRTLLAAGLVLGATGATDAEVIALYTFNDGTPSDTSGSPTTYDLNTIGSGITYAQTGETAYAFFPGNDGSPSYLQTAGPGGLPNWTVSLWFRTATADQGPYQGIFSNNTSSSASYSWQLDVDNGTYKVRSAVAGFSTLTFGTPTTGAWQNVIVQKRSGSLAEVWLNGVSQGTENTNPGGLQYFRIGTNRNTSRLYTMDVDEVKIWDSAENAVTIFNDGPVLVPEPSTLVLAGLGLAGLGFCVWQRRRNSDSPERAQLRAPGPF